MSVSLSGVFSVQEFADAGAPLVLGRLYTFSTGTTTQKTAYTDAAGAIPHTYTSDGAGGSYIALNSRGELPAPLYLASGPYDLALKRADGSTVWTRRADGIAPNLTVSDARAYPWLATGDGTTDDTAALNAFLAAVTRGRISAGTYKITGPLNFQSNQVITGDGPSTVIKYAAVAPAANSPVLNFVAKSHTRVSGLTLQIPASTYTTARSIFMDTCTDVRVSDILFSGGAGGNAAYLAVCTGCYVSHCWVDDYRSNGFYVNLGAGNVIEDNDIPDGSGGMMGIQFVEGESHIARFNRIAKTPDNFFGIHLYGGKFFCAHGNFIKNTRREALAVGGTTNIGARVTGNTFYWDTNLGVGDFGMSVAGNDTSNVCGDFLIEGNTIINSSLDGIGVSGFCQRGRITNNIIRDCAQASAANFLSGIKLYGWIAGAFVNDVVVEANTISKVSGGGMTTGVHEEVGLGTVGGNIIRDNKCFGLPAGDFYTRVSALLALNDEDISTRQSDNPVTSSSGSITTATGSLRYSRVGNFVVCRLIVTDTTNGTGATSMLYTLPFTAIGGTLTGADTANTKKACKATVSGTQLTITAYDNTYPAATGSVLDLTGVLLLG